LPRLAEELREFFRRSRCGGFPFGFGRQPRVRPARVGVGLEIRDMDERPLQVERKQSGQRELPPGIAFVPIDRVAVIAGGAPVPAFGQPETRVGGAAGVDKSEILAIRDEARRELAGRDEDAKAQCLVVVTKA